MQTVREPEWKVTGRVLAPVFWYLSSSICQINKFTVSAATFCYFYLVVTSFIRFFSLPIFFLRDAFG